MLVSFKELDKFAFVFLMLTVLFFLDVYGLIVIESIFYILINLVFVVVLNKNIDCWLKLLDGLE